MPAKILNAFADENPDLHKQIGCMTGILQMFDRHHLISGRRLNDHNHKKHSSGQNLSNSRNYGETYSSSQQILLERNLSKSLNENRRVSIDSSRASCSSSSSSSSSSFLDCNKSMQQDAASFDRTFFQERSLKSSLNTKAYESDAKSNSCSNGQTATIQHDRQYHDLRNVVKDSMQRDGKNLLPVKTSIREEERDQTAKQRSSPRLQFLSKATEGIYATRIDSKLKVAEDLNEPVRALLKLKQAPLGGFSETKDSCYRVSRQSPRFSCDGREFSRTPIDSRDDSKAIVAKLRDLPRLSLDSREGSLRSSNLVSRASTLMEDLNKSSTPRLSKASSLHEDPGSYKRPPGLVAKLMGLEELPKPQEPITKQINGSFMSSPAAKSPKSARAMKENKVCESPKSSPKDSSATKAKSCGPSVKQNSRITTEAAPWVQQERGRAVRRTVVGCPEAKTKQRSASVYSEIVKKLKELEFQQSNKDLRALKQILDTMHAKALLEATNDDEQQPLPSAQGNLREQTPARKHSSKSSGSPRALESPAKSVSKSGVPPLSPSGGNQSVLPRLRTNGTCDRSKDCATSKTDKDQSPRVSPRLLNVQMLLPADKQLGKHAAEITIQKPRSNPLQSLSKVQHSLRDDNGSYTANSCSVSPRLQQRRAEAEKKQPNNSSELSKAQKLSANRQQVESISPRGKFRLKQAQAQIQKIEDRANETSRETRNSSCQSAISKRSDKNITLTSLVDLEAIRINRSIEMKSAFLQQCLHSPSNRAVSNATSLLNQKNSLPIVDEYTANKDILSFAFDQTSPVSVLDTSFYQDGLPTSPVKRTLNAPKDDETIDNYCSFTGSPDSKPSKLSSEVIAPKRAEVLINFVQEDRKPTVGQLRATDSTTFKCDMVNPDHKYVAEILQATGLLQKDFNIGSKCRFPVQTTHSSGQAINPDLFYVLEQLKPSRPAKPEPGRPKPVSDKSHRKLVFDVVNEILAQKLELIAYDNRLQFQIPDRKISGQCLLQELCSDIDQLQQQSSKKSGGLFDDDNGDGISGEEILHQTQGWTDCRTETHEMVLEIERLIFKDLISEIISDVAGPRSGQANC